MATSIREWLLRLSVLLGTLFLCLVVLEGIVRFAEPREVMRYFFVQPDTVLHHKFIPNAKGRYKTTEFDTRYNINSLGLRDREYSLETAWGVFRILMVGDSFTEGDGVEEYETFSKYLEQELNVLGSRREYEVINSGCGSYSPLLEYLYLKTAGLRLDPDLVILNFDLSDVFDDIQYTRLARFDTKGEPTGVSPETEQHDQGWIVDGLVAAKDFLKSHAHLYNFVRLRIGRYIEGARHEATLTGDLHYDKYAMLRGNYRYQQSDWSLSYKYILMIREMLEKRGISFYVAVYPYGLQVSRREYDAGRQFWGFRRDTLYSTEPQQRIEQFCRENKIHVINACEDFRTAARSQYPLYLAYNGHWTAAGHRLYSQVLFQALQSQVILR